MRCKVKRTIQAERSRHHVAQASSSNHPGGRATPGFLHRPGPQQGNEGNGSMQRNARTIRDCTANVRPSQSWPKGAMLMTIHNAWSPPCRDATRSRAAACTSRTATATWSPYRRPGISWCCPTSGPFESPAAGAAAGCCCVVGGQGGRGRHSFAHRIAHPGRAPLVNGECQWGNALLQRRPGRALVRRSGSNPRGSHLWFAVGSAHLQKPAT